MKMRKMAKDKATAYDWRGMMCYFTNYKWQSLVTPINVHVVFSKCTMTHVLYD